MGSVQADNRPSSLTAYDPSGSPFLELSTPFNFREAIKMALLLPFLIPRTLIGISACAILASLSYIAALGWPIDQPFPAWRRKIVVLASKCAGLVLLMLGFRVKIQGWENVEKARKVGALGLFNHSSWVDAVTMMWLFAPSGVSKESNAHLPLIGTCIKAFQNIYVPRGKTAKSPTLGGKSMSQAIADRAKDRRFPMLMMAPEGTCGDGRGILKFKTGAFVPGVPVMPVVLRYDKSCHNPAWVIINEGWSFVRMMCQFWNVLEVTILPPYIPSQAEVSNASLYASNVRRLYAETLHVPLVEQGLMEYDALTVLQVGVSWDGRRVVAPPGVIDEEGFVDLTIVKQE